MVYFTFSSFFYIYRYCSFGYAKLFYVLHYFRLSHYFLLFFIATKKICRIGAGVLCDSKHYFYFICMPFLFKRVFLFVTSKKPISTSAYYGRRQVDKKSAYWNVKAKIAWIELRTTLNRRCTIQPPQLFYLLIKRLKYNISNKKSPVCILKYSIMQK